MSHSPLRLVGLVLCLGSIAATAACSAAPEENEEAVEKVQSAVLSCEFGDPDCDPSTGEDVGVGCDSSLTTTQQKARQKSVTKAWKYILGGSTNPCASASDGEVQLDYVRSAVQSGDCTITPATKQTVCGISAAVYGLQCKNLDRMQFYSVKSLPDALDTCMGSGSGAFFSVSGSSSVSGTAPPYWVNMKVDPEPARLTADLTGSNGATAAAVYINSSTSTSVVRWSSTYSAGIVSAGTPCSTSTIYTGSETIKTIQASGSYRKCL